MSTPTPSPDHAVTPIRTTGADLGRLVWGAAELEDTDRGLLPHRLPAWARAQNQDPQLALVESQPSGVRLAFRSAASTVRLETIPTKRRYAGLPAPSDGVYELYVDGEPAGVGSVHGGDRMEMSLSGGAAALTPGEPGSLTWTDLQPHPKDVEVWLPHDERTVVVAIETDAPVQPREPRSRRTWVHHGSSISQGSGADGPSRTWPAVAARSGGFDLVNLGLGGSALLDPFVGRVLRDSSADLISVELGINLVNLDLMRRRALGPALHGLLDTVREKHATTPIVIVSPILCPMHEDTPGPTAVDVDALSAGRLAFTAAGDAAEVAAGRLTLTVVRDEIDVVLGTRDDEMIRLVDGRSLYGPADHDERPLPDGLHPGPETHLDMGRRFAALVLDRPGALAGT